MKKGLMVFAISTIADGGHQAFAKGGKGSSSSSSSHGSSRGSSSHGKSSYGSSRGSSLHGTISNNKSRARTKSNSFGKEYNKGRYSHGVITRNSNLRSNPTDRSLRASRNNALSKLRESKERLGFGNNSNITSQIGKNNGKQSTNRKSVSVNMSNRTLTKVGSNNMIRNTYRSKTITKRGMGLQTNKSRFGIRNNIVISNRSLQDNKPNKTQLNIVSPNVNKFRSRIFGAQNMTFYRTNNNQLI